MSPGKAAGEGAVGSGGSRIGDPGREVAPSLGRTLGQEWEWVFWAELGLRRLEFRPEDDGLECCRVTPGVDAQGPFSHTA